MRDVQLTRRIPTAVERIGLAGIVACERTAELVRALDTQLGLRARFGRDHEIVVVDDTRSAASRVLHRDLVQARPGVRYLGREEKERFAEHLAREVGAAVRPEVIRFLLFGDGLPLPTIGGNRNALLLWGAGRRWFSLDDDVETVVGPVPASPRALDGERAAADAIWFFGSREEALAAAPDSGLDPLTLCERAQAARGVRLVAFGYAGDSGAGRPILARLVEGDSRRRLLADPNRYERLRTTREVVRGPSRAVASRHPGFMAGAFSGDGARLLPPFFPMGRNEDSLFAAVLLAVDREALIARLPFVVRHTPAPRSAAGAALELSFRLCDVLLLAVGDFMRQAPGTGYGPLGRHLRMLASRSPSELGEVLGGLQREGLRRLAARLDRSLRDEPGALQRWKDDVRELLDIVHREAAASDLIPAELSGQPQPWQTVARSIASFAEALEVWPALIAAATRLHAA